MINVLRYLFCSTDIVHTVYSVLYHYRYCLMFTFAFFRPYGSLSRCLRGNMGGPSWMGFRSDMILLHPFFNFQHATYPNKKWDYNFPGNPLSNWKWVTGLQFSFEASIDPLWDASCTLLSYKVLENIVTVSWSRIAKMNFQPKIQLAMPGCLVWLEFCDESPELM